MENQNEPSKEQMQAYQKRVEKMLGRINTHLTDEERQTLDRAVKESRQSPGDTGIVGYHLVGGGWFACTVTGPRL